jgi:hypothetical protein
MTASVAISGGLCMSIGSRKWRLVTKLKLGAYGFSSGDASPARPLLGEFVGQRSEVGGDRLPLLLGEEIGGLVRTVLGRARYEGAS